MNQNGSAKVMAEVFDYPRTTGVAIDGGAHVGVWSKAMAERYQEVLSFEANPGTAEMLRKNTQGIPNVKVHNKALGWDHGALVKTMWRKLDFTATNRISDEGLEVETITIDSMKLQDVSFIKFDLEGFEYFALQGAKWTILRDRPPILIEEKDGLPQFYGLPLRAARELLESWGMYAVKHFKIDVLMDWPTEAMVKPREMRIA